MHKIIIQLPINRDYTGRLEVQNASGKRLAGPFKICGRADDERAQANKNPARNPLLPFGDTPLGEYKVVKIIGSGSGTPYGSDEFGSAGLVLLQPKQGDAVLADANGRFGFFIQGGARPRSGLLRPTLDGSLRLSDGDQRKLISTLQRADEVGCVCTVISTAKAGVKVAIATEKPAVRSSRRNPQASLLLASSVVASLVTGTIRQALLRTTLHGAGASLASSGLVLVAADHASAQPAGGDYNPAGVGAMDQLNTVEHNSQDATHATTDEAAHDKASQGFDTPSSVSPPVDLSGKEGIVDPNAASGNLPPASAAGLAPGSPTFSAPQPSSTPEETPPAPSAAPENQPGDQNMQEQAAPVTQSPSETQPDNNDVSQPHLKDSLPGIYLNDTSGNGNNNPAGIPSLPGIYVNGPRSESDATGPSDTTLRPLDQIDRGVKAPEETGSSDANQPNTPAETPSASIPEQENQSMQEDKTPADNAPQPTTPPQEKLRDAVAEPSASPTAPNSSAAPENQNNPAVATPLENASQPAPTEQSPAAKAMVDHDSQNLANPSDQNQSEPATSSSLIPVPIPLPTTPSSDFSVKSSDTTANNLSAGNSADNTYDGEAVAIKAKTLQDQWNAGKITYDQVDDKDYPKDSPNVSANNTSDCSHFVHEALQQSGYTVPYVTTSSIGTSPAFTEVIDIGQVQRGDIIVQYPDGGPAHMGIYTESLTWTDGEDYYKAVAMGGLNKKTGNYVNEYRWSEIGGKGTAVSEGGTIKFYRPKTIQAPLP